MTHVGKIALVLTAAVVASGSIISIGSATRPLPAATWNPQAAAAYLDQRQGWWQSWPKAARDHGTVCVSCHTALPYALVRPELRATLSERDTAGPERRLMADVVTRVRAWSEVKPFYGDSTAAGAQKAIESRGTEAVLNALILASRDQRTGTGSSDARLALSNMFALQHASGDQEGAWSWLNFGLRPWESTNAVYFGAALAAIAVGREPAGYSTSSDIQPNLARLQKYLRSHVDEPLWNRLLRRDDPALFNRALLLWASAGLPALMSSDERRSTLAALFSAQEPDGAWRLASLGHWQQPAGVSFDSTGDGYATGLIAYALEQTGAAPNEPHLARALAWLAQHQDPATGRWVASSLNKKRDPASNVGRFMADAATGFAALALLGAERR